MMKAGTTTIGMLIALATAIGCEAPEMPDSGGTAAAPAVNAPADRANADPAETEDKYERAARVNQANPDVPQGNASPATDEPTRFDPVNDPVRGRRSRERGGSLGAIVAVRFSAEHMAIDISIKQALRYYQAEHGEFPQSHDEFMEKIIRANRLTLPELMEGEEYIYVPEQGFEGLCKVASKPSAN